MDLKICVLNPLTTEAVEEPGAIMSLIVIGNSAAKIARNLCGLHRLKIIIVSVLESSQDLADIPIEDLWQSEVIESNTIDESELSESIHSKLVDSHLIFVVADLGKKEEGEIAARVARKGRDIGSLVIGLVSTPSTLEGGSTLKVAQKSLISISEHTDSLISYPRDEILTDLNHKDAVDHQSNEVRRLMETTISGITSMIEVQGLVCVDFEDVRTVMGGEGKAKMGTAIANGDNKSHIAARNAIASPTLGGIYVAAARGLFVHISSARKALKMRRINEVMNVIKEYAAESAHIIFGTNYVESLGEDICVTVIATGLDQYNPKPMTAELQQYGQTQMNDEVIRRKKVTVEALAASGTDRYDIPLFLRGSSQAISRDDLPITGDNTMGDETDIDQYFNEANAALNKPVRCISDISHNLGLVNPDFEDVMTVLRTPDRATVGISQGDDETVETDHSKSH